MGVWDGEMAGEHMDSGLGHKKTWREWAGVKGLKKETWNESQSKKRHDVLMLGSSVYPGTL